MKIYLLLMFAMLPGAVSLVVLQPNATQEFNYTNEFNTTSTENFFCSLPESVFNISLLPGQNDTISKDGNTVYAACIANTPQCIIRADVQAGATFTRQDSACDIEISMAPQPDDPVVKVRKAVEITKRGGVVTVIIDNRTFNPPSDLDSYSQNYDIELLCPTQVPFNNPEDIEDLLGICREFLPLATQGLTSTIDVCLSSASTHASDVKEGSASLTLKQEQLSQCEVSKIELQKAFEAALASEAEARAEFEELTNEKNTWRAFSIIAFILLALVTCVCAWMYHNNERGGE